MTYDGNSTLTYDAEGRAVSASNGGSSGAYVYDGNGLRVKRCVPNCTSPTTTTVYIFSGSKVIAEYDSGAAPSSPSREYIYSGSQLLATISGGTTTYHHPDQLSVRVSTDANGNVTRTFGHFPFGEVWYETGTASKWKFSTYERDTESGNDYAMARFYRSNNARFASPDPIPGSASDPQSLNRYSYAVSDPIDFVDFSGLTCQAVWFGGGVQVMCDPLNGGAAADGGAAPDGGSPHYAPLLDAPDSGRGNSSGGGFFTRIVNLTKTCTAKAIGSGLLHVGIDAIGLIPEGGLVSRAVGNYAGYRGIVATQQGTKALQAGKLGTGIANTGVSAGDTSGIGVAQTGLGVAGIVSTLAGATPVVGQAISVVSIGVDILSAGREVAKCN
jgi:RHS repeat-associated protein